MKFKKLLLGLTLLLGLCTLSGCGKTEYKYAYVQYFSSSYKVYEIEKYEYVDQNTIRLYLIDGLVFEISNAKVVLSNDRVPNIG